MLKNIRLFLCISIFLPFFEVIAEKESGSTGDMDKEEIYQSDLDDDPLEFINRPVFEFNRIVDGILIDPLANMYKNVFPLKAQKRVSSFLRNLSEPVTFTNDCLQIKGQAALESFCRFFLNTTFGIFGLFDVAEALGLPKHKETFNTTLQYWGVPQGPYIVLPVLGPTCPRVLIGLTTDYFTDPFYYYIDKNNETGLLYTRIGLEFLVRRADITDDIRNFRETSLDFYAAMRSFYKQYMNANREGEKITYSSPSLEEFMFDDE